MNTHIQIRNVPQDLHRKLKIRAAEKDMSISDYVRRLVEYDLNKPTLGEMAERLKMLAPVGSTEEIVEMIRQDRDTR